ncbi:cysteine desulfurase-like protein [Paractinoplanes abujensis]|uniref:Cysteine desulfurase family protein (TIGR01976 family) n=1 Tax=Paractinoplanes abujensis TaxID=882441 RepID=A0A7W7CS96_9ACTN|nr:cysteine desulfurase-like protein [Actinoplanes abujensis]MBB4692358.1 cysteine desulfurase family protein (TIGR01976 family) [Actinoplanes abujensis]GID24164.1 cysteine desulfurase-like protein [Actinoplanes abujensis]
MSFDVARIRSDYPALAEGFVHFDGAGGTQPAAPVIEAIAAAMRTAVSNRGTAHEPARRSGEIAAAARSAVADLVGGDPAGVAFGPSATALTYLVARTLAQGWGPGDEVVLSRLDHDANVRPWVQTGATVRWADVDPATGELPVAQYAELIGPRTRLVAVTAASNAVGTVPAVREIADLAHAAGAQVYVDGVHATAHRPTDVAALGADFYVTSAYKWSGPHYAAVIADPAVWEPLQPVKLIPSPSVAPDRFEYGTLSFELLAGVTAAVDHLASLAPSGGPRRERVLASIAAAEEHENGLAARLLTGLRANDKVTLCPAGRDRCPTISFRVAGQTPAETARLLGEQGICVSHGDYYAVEYFEAAGLRATGGAVRASLYHYNTAEEVDRLLAALGRL